MAIRQKFKKTEGRGQRHSAAWGKRLCMTFLLATGMVYGQMGPQSQHARAFKGLAPELTQLRSRLGAASKSQVNVIVTYKSTPQTSSEARVAKFGGRLSNRLDLIKSRAYSVPVSALSGLENDPEIDYVTVDHALKGMDDYTDAAMNVGTAWNAGYDGTGIGVAVIDSGINDSSNDFGGGTNSRVLYHQDFTGTTTYLKNKQIWDLYGHGTHVAGIIGGNGNKSNGRYAGVAPNVNLIDLRVLDAERRGQRQHGDRGHPAGDRAEEYLQH